MLIRLLRRFVVMNALEEGGGGGAPVVDSAPAAVEPAAAPVAAPVAAPTAEPSKPASMLDAINKALDAGEQPQGEGEAADGRARDAQGRFIAKTGEQPPAQPGAQPQQQAKKPEQPTPEKPEDLHQMPEGLGQKAQQRFQQLVERNKEYAQRAEQAEAQASYIREVFQTHGVTREQFDQATQFIGALNKGNLRGARDFLVGQLRELSIALGEPMQGVDALADFPDLRQKVDQGLVGEAQALEVARARRAHETLTSQAEQQRQAQMQQRQTAQAIEQGQKAVDAWARKMQAEDIDFAHLEEQLLPEIPNLIRGVPPSAWTSVIESNYRALKRAVGSVRQSAPAAGATVLRPTGPSSPAARPSSMFEAMWGAKAPA